MLRKSKYSSLSSSEQLELDMRDYRCFLKEAKKEKLHKVNQEIDNAKLKLELENS